MSYEIADEPHETPWRHLVVNPSGPLLAEMVCGSWLAIPWFAFNAIAMGSPTRRKEIGLCIAQLVGTAVMAAILIALVDRDIIESATVIRLCLLGIVTWKLGLGYAINIVQSRTFHVYEYYEGQVRSATIVLATGYMLRPYILEISDHPLWRIIVSALGLP
jgi:hypothetical protein